MRHRHVCECVWGAEHIQLFTFLVLCLDEFCMCRMFWNLFYILLVKMTHYLLISEEVLGMVLVFLPMESMWLRPGTPLVGPICNFVICNVLTEGLLEEFRITDSIVPG
jgi:hypothetical protein